MISQKIRVQIDWVKLALAIRLKPRFRAFHVAVGNSLCKGSRLQGLHKLADMIARSKLAGDVVECGVYRGGSAVVIAERLLRSRSKREMWLFDVFSGMPQPGPQDPPEAWADVGKFVSSPSIVKETFAAAKIPTAHVNIVSGRFENTLPHFSPPAIAFLHIDCDWYDPVTLCLETFYDAVIRGGVVVFDDYGFWSGCRSAVDEFIARRSLNIRLTPIDSESHYFIKP